MIFARSRLPALPALLLALIGLTTGTLTTAARAEPVTAPRVVTSIRPLQSLAAGIMAGVGTPTAIVRDAGSPHTYVIRPSEARALSRADLVFWIGPDYEGFLAKPITALGGRARIVTLRDVPGIETLPARQGGTWEKHHDNDADANAASPHTADPHIFLDPHNAEAMVRAMADALDAIDPVHQADYDANAGIVTARLKSLDDELARQLAPVRARPFIVFHDGYQYLEHRYGLTAAGSVVVSPERPPGARRLAQIREKIGALRVACVFSEPEFDSALVRTVVAGTPARTAALDYIGVDLKPGPDAYFGMMRGLARTLVGCLSGRETSG